MGEIEELYEDRIVDEQVVQWNARDNSVLARRRRRLGALLIEDKPLVKPDPEKVQGPRCWTASASAACRGTMSCARGASASPSCVASTRAGRICRTRRCLPRSTIGSRHSSTAMRSASIFAAALKTLVPWDRQRQVDSLAPTHVEVPSGSRVPIDYANPAEPTLSVRLQEMFGLTDTPKVGGGKVPVLIHLLSPARRPVQVTRDLASFWTSGYKAVKAELKGRYPRHYWPDDPLVAEPTARVRPQAYSVSMR